MERLLVTGGAGRSGKWFVRRLCQETPDNVSSVRFLTRSSTLPELDGLSIPHEVVRGDIHDAETMRRAVKDIDTVLHIAGIYSSLHLTEAALEAGVKRLILVHTTGVFSKFKRASADYLDIEARIQQMVAGSDIDVTILRPTMIYGSLDDQNISKFIRLVDRFPVFPVVRGGHSGLQPVNHRDLGEAYLQVLAAPAMTAGRSYILSGSEPIDLIDLLTLMSEGLGVRRHFVNVPLWFAYSASVLVYAASLKRIDYREKVLRLVEPRVFSHAEAARDFGYRPMPLEQGILSSVGLYRASQGRSPLIEEPASSERNVSAATAR